MIQLFYGLWVYWVKVTCCLLLYYTSLVNSYILLSNHLKYPTCHSLTRKCHIQLCDLLRNTESEDCDLVIYWRMIVYEFHKAFNT